jgi:hypothetical protein
MFSDRQLAFHFARRERLFKWRVADLLFVFVFIDQWHFLFAICCSTFGDRTVLRGEQVYSDTFLAARPATRGAWFVLLLTLSVAVTLWSFPSHQASQTPNTSSQEGLPDYSKMPYVAPPRRGETLQYSCDNGGLTFKVTFSGNSSEQVAIDDSANHEYRLHLTKEKLVRKYASNRGDIIFAMQSPTFASLTVVDVLYLHCRASSNTSQSPGISHKK